MLLNDCFNELDQPLGRHNIALKALLNFRSELALQGAIERFERTHLQGLKTSLQSCITKLVTGDPWLQERLIDIFIEAGDVLQMLLMPSLAQLGAKDLILKKLSHACITETDPKRGYRYLKLMKSFPNDWEGDAGQQIRKMLQESQFVHRYLLLCEELSYLEQMELYRKSDVVTLSQIKDVKVLKQFIQGLDENSYLGNNIFAHALVKIGKPAVKYLIQALSDKKWFVRKHALLILVLIGESAVAPLIQNLKRNRCWQSRYHSAEILGYMGSSEAIDILRFSLRDTHESVREKAAEGLEKIKRGRPNARFIYDIDIMNIVWKLTSYIPLQSFESSKPSLNSDLDDKIFANSNKNFKGFGRGGEPSFSISYDIGKNLLSHKKFAFTTKGVKLNTQRQGRSGYRR